MLFKITSCSFNYSKTILYLHSGLKIIYTCLKKNKKGRKETKLKGKRRKPNT